MISKHAKIVNQVASNKFLVILRSIHIKWYTQVKFLIAFLNRELDEEIYMDQPIGFVAKGKERKVCKFK
jgi:hypothetical protein